MKVPSMRLMICCSSRSALLCTVIGTWPKDCSGAGYLAGRQAIMSNDYAEAADSQPALGHKTAAPCA